MHPHPHTDFLLMRGRAPTTVPPPLEHDPNPMALRCPLSGSWSQMACKRRRGEQRANTVSVSLPPHSWIPLPALICGPPRRELSSLSPHRLRQERRSASSLGKPFRQPHGTTLWLVLTITISYPQQARPLMPISSFRRLVVWCSVLDCSKGILGTVSQYFESLQS